MIRVQDVKFRYDPEQPTYAVDGVSLNVRRGEFVAVLGANGCGKSTLAKHFNAILLPETGTVLVENMDTRGEDHLYDIRQKVGMVFQNPDNQIVATIVEEDVAFAPENLGVPTEEIRTRIDEAMKLAGIYEKREAAPYKLSGGQKQRVAIAGVIAMRPDCLEMCIRDRLTGLRPGELVGLQWNDIHGNTVQVQRAINVRGEVTRGKNENAVRSFVLSTMARRVLDEQRKITGDAGSVFCIMREKTYYSRWKAYCKANGLTPCSLYELRHTFVSVVKTLPAGEVKGLVGHSQDMDTFGVYGLSLIHI